MGEEGQGLEVGGMAGQVSQKWKSVKDGALWQETA